MPGLWKSIPLNVYLGNSVDVPVLRARETFELIHKKTHHRRTKSTQIASLREGQVKSAAEAASDNIRRRQLCRRAEPRPRPHSGDKATSSDYFPLRVCFFDPKANIGDSQAVRRRVSTPQSPGDGQPRSLVVLTSQFTHI